MAITIWPANAVAGAPAYSGRMLRQTTVGVPLAGATTARPLGLFSGVRPGTSTNTVTVSGSTISVAAFAGAIDGEAANEAGGYEFSSDAVTSLTLTAANATNPRVDIVYVQVSDPAESDGSSNPGVAILYLAGTAAATPTAPTTPARSFVLAQINVPKSGGGSATVTWVAPYLAAAGAPIGFATETALLANTSFPFATEALVYTTGAWYVMGLSSTWARRGLNLLSTGMANTSGGVVAAGATSTAYGSYTANLPVRGTLHVHGQAYVYTGSTTTAMAGSFYAGIDGTAYAADGKRGRIHSHGRAGWALVNMDADFDLAPGSHAIAVYVAADPSTANIELWDVTWNYSVVY